MMEEVERRYQTGIIFRTVSGEDISKRMMEIVNRYRVFEYDVRKARKVVSISCIIY